MAHVSLPEFLGSSSHNEIHGQVSEKSNIHFKEKL